MKIFQYVVQAEKKSGRWVAHVYDDDSNDPDRAVHTTGVYDLKRDAMVVAVKWLWRKL